MSLSTYAILLVVILTVDYVGQSFADLSALIIDPSDDKWQPLATAPRGDVQVLIWWTPENHAARAQWVVGEGVWRTESQRGSYPVRDEEIAAWQPIRQDSKWNTFSPESMDAPYRRLQGPISTTGFVGRKSA